MDETRGTSWCLCREMMNRFAFYSSDQSNFGSWGEAGRSSGKERRQMLRATPTAACAWRRLACCVHLVQQPHGDGLPEDHPFLAVKPVVNP